MPKIVKKLWTQSCSWPQERCWQELKQPSPSSYISIFRSVSSCQRPTGLQLAGESGRGISQSSSPSLTKQYMKWWAWGWNHKARASSLTSFFSLLGLKLLDWGLSNSGFPGTPPSFSRTSESHNAFPTKKNLEYLTVMPFLGEDYKSISYLFGPEIL